jgi:uncharacterized LabA/DUF88 family protein
MKTLGVFVDVSNLYFGTNIAHGSHNASFGRRLNYAAYRKFIDSLGTVSTAVAYGGQVKNEAERFITKLRDVGFITKYKEPRITKIGDKTKWSINWNVGMTVDIVRTMESEPVDIIVLGSSDDNMIPMIEYIQERYGATFVVLASNITKKMKTLKGVTCIEIPRSLLETVHRRRHENS